MGHDLPVFLISMKMQIPASNQKEYLFSYDQQYDLAAAPVASQAFVCMGILQRK